jgi:RNA polymerase sigma factor (sigma-70 family)
LIPPTAASSALRSTLNIIRNIFVRFDDLATIVDKEMIVNDQELLRQYAQNRSEDAFTAVVRRHVDLVYSTALRLVRLPHLAEEVSQTVFSDLSRQAGKINAKTPLAAWLYRVTRNTAVDLVRRETRRQMREQTAAQMKTENTSPAWPDIEPMVDEALDDLAEQDRNAVVLRFFENQNLREVGEQLGISEDAARKRVSRALDHMREFFIKRGITLGSTSLISLLSANAVQSAPASLAAVICASISTAGITLPAATATTLTIVNVMTLTQKAFITAVITLTAGLAIYENRQVIRLEREVANVRQSQQPLVQQVNSLKQANETAKTELQQTQKQLSDARKNEAELYRLRGQYTQMRNQVQAYADREKRTANTPPAAAIAPPPALPISQTHAIKTLVRIPNGHTLVTGGWSTGNGKRTLALVTPQSQDGDEVQNQVMVRTMMVEAPDEVWQQLGLASVQNEPGQDPQAGAFTLTAEQMEKTSKILQETKGVDVLSSPTLSTLSGREAQIVVGEQPSPGTTNLSPGIKYILIPTLTADHAAVDLNLELQVTTVTTNR